MMNSMLINLVKANLILLIAYGLYYILLHRSSYLQLNRFILIALPLLAILIPWLQIDPGNSHGFLAAGPLEEFSEFPLDEQVYAVIPRGGFPEGAGIWFLLIYGIGCSFFLIRMIRQIAGIVRLKRQSECIKQGKILYILTDRKETFSFFNWIFIPCSAFHEQDIIIEHEQIHVRQKHTLDLFWIELAQLFFWYNPAHHWTKKSLRETHEFIADGLMIRRNQDVSVYLSVLLNSVEKSVVPDLVNPFRRSSLKNRIRRMLSTRRPLMGKMAYLFYLPIMLLLVLSFSRSPEMGSKPSILPLEDVSISLNFGYQGIHPVKKEPFVHKGIDFRAASGTPVLATAGGMAEEVTETEGWGKLIVLRHPEGITTYYAHLDDFSIEKGERVVCGQIIGHVGNTGYSTGPHLHYEVRLNNEPVDPLDYVK